MGGARKGAQFEREFCIMLSQWWADRDDVFWRSSQSGGRATMRARKGKRTAGSYGDIAAIDAVGQPLLDIVTIELKRGYNKDTVHDILDSPGTREETWETFFQQATVAASLAQSKSWWLISRRDARRASLWMPQDMFDHMDVLWVTSVVSVTVKMGSRVYCGVDLEYLWDVKPSTFRKKFQ